MKIAHVACLVSIVLSAPLIAGCSGNPNEPGLDSGEDGVRGVVIAFGNALEGGDPARSCSLMTKKAQDLLISDTKSAGCLEAVASWRNEASDQERERAKSDKLAVTIAGDAAVAGIAGSGEVSPLTTDGAWRLVREASRWMIDAPR